MSWLHLHTLPDLPQTLRETKENTLLSSLHYKRLSDWTNVQPIKKQDRKSSSAVGVLCQGGGGGVSASILCTGEGRLIKGGISGTVRQM